MNTIVTIGSTGIKAMTASEWFANLPTPDGYAGQEPLPQAMAVNVAKQCTDMGVKVGDVIIGREGGPNGTWWHDAELTLLWLGTERSAWSVRSRTDKNPHWENVGEATNWTLTCRKWFRVVHSDNAEPNGF